MSNKKKADIPLQVNVTSEERDFIDRAIGHLPGRVSRSGFMAGASLEKAKQVIQDHRNTESFESAITG